MGESIKVYLAEIDGLWLAACVSRGAVIRCSFSKDRDGALSPLRRLGRGVSKPSLDYMGDGSARLAIEAMLRRIRGLSPEEAPPLDLSRLSGFSRRVLEAASRIPRGYVSTYRDVASSIGCVGGWRAVGAALRGNPWPLLIPCHRVVRSDLTIGGYMGSDGEGASLKRRLLEMEGVKFKGERVSPESLWRLGFEADR
ncbi:MAG: MGMT family protein [Candidatus Bathyarchaeia archaeon]